MLLGRAEVRVQEGSEIGICNGMVLASLGITPHHILQAFNGRYTEDGG